MTARLACLLSLLWGSALPALGQSVSTESMQGLGEVFYHRVVAKELDHEYHVFVRLPEGYETNGEKLYPTVYLLDGGATFPLLATYYAYLRFGEEVPDLIVVGISYGNNDWDVGNMRSRDYTAPAAEREHWGGADRFRTFLRQEVIPLVESRYRSDSGRRVVFGQSLGGQFVLHTALHAPNVFWGYIASNPALHRNLSLFLEPVPAAPATSDSATRPRLFVASGSLDEPRFRRPAVEWMAHWSAQPALPWDLETRTLDGQSHMSAVPEAFRQGLVWLFAADGDHR